MPPCAVLRVRCADRPPPLPAQYNVFLAVPLPITKSLHARVREKVEALVKAAAEADGGMDVGGEGEAPAHTDGHAPSCTLAGKLLDAADELDAALDTAERANRGDASPSL